MNISDSIHSAIEQWIGKSKNNNLHVLADKLNMQYPTLYRIFTRQVAKPNFETTMKIIRLVLPKEKQLDFLDEHWPGIKTIYENSYFENIPDKVDQYDRPDLEKLFTQRDGFFLAQHLISRCGITEEKIEELYGFHGLEILKNLEKEGSVLYDDGVWRIAVKDYVSDSLEGNLLQVEHSATAFRAGGGEVGAAYVRTLSESVTLEAAKKIRNELDAVAIRIDNIAKENPGNHVYLCNVLTQLLDPEAAIKEDWRNN